MIASVLHTNFRFAIFTALFLAGAGMAVYTGNYIIAILPFTLLLVYAGWQYPEAIFLLLLAALPFSMEYQLSATLGTDLPDELLMVIVSIFYLLYIFYKPQTLPRLAWSHPLILLIALSIVWAIVSAVFSTQGWLSVKFLLAKSWYLGAFVLAPLLVFTNKQGIRWSAIIFLSALLLVMIITMVRHGAYGFSFASINDALSPFFRNHVNYSAMLVCSVPVLLVYRQSLKTGNKKRILSILIIVVIAALFLSYARGAWLALFIGLLAGWMLKKKKLVTAYLIVILIVTGAVAWLKADDRYLRYAHDYRSTIFHEDFREHLVATYQFKDVSTAERFYRWIAGVRMINDNWLTGAGPNSFYPAYKSYTVPAFRTWVSDNRERSTVHNYFLLLAVEQGIPGLLIFLLLAGTVLYYAQLLYHRTKDDFYKRVSLAVGMIFSMILTVNFLSDLIETDKIGSLFFLCISLLVATDLATRGNRQTSSDPSPHI